MGTSKKDNKKDNPVDKRPADPINTEKAGIWDDNEDWDELTEQSLEPIAVVTTPMLLRRLVSEKKKERDKITGKFFNQKIMAERLGVSEQTFTEWLKDDYNGRYRGNNIELLADFFDVDVDYLECRQIEKRKGQSDDPEEVRGLNLEKYLKTLGFSFLHDYGVDPLDGIDPYTGEFPPMVEKIYKGKYIDENGVKREKSEVYYEPDPEHKPSYGRPLLVTLPSGREILMRDRTFYAYAKEFEEWAEFAITKLLQYGHLDDVNSGTIPDDEDDE